MASRPSSNADKRARPTKALRLRFDQSLQFGQAFVLLINTSEYIKRIKKILLTVIKLAHIEKQRQRLAIILFCEVSQMGLALCFKKSKKTSY